MVKKLQEVGERYNRNNNTLRILSTDKKG